MINRILFLFFLFFSINSYSSVLSLDGNFSDSIITFPPSRTGLEGAPSRRTFNYRWVSTQLICAHSEGSQVTIQTTGGGNSRDYFAACSGRSSSFTATYRSCPEGETESNGVCVPPPAVCEEAISDINFISLRGKMCDSSAACGVKFNDKYSTQNGWEYVNNTRVQPDPTGECEYDLQDFRDAKDSDEEVCEYPEVNDTYTNECVCGDNTSCKADDDELDLKMLCDDSGSCLQAAKNNCPSGQQLMNYEYFGGEQYNSSCGFKENDCPADYAWDIGYQSCLQDQDNDGTVDDEDPDPTNPEIDGDSDDDGVPDTQDKFPDDPERSNEFTDNSNTFDKSGFKGESVAPVGESDKFNDTAIVSAINENTKTANETNKLSESSNALAAAGNKISDEGFGSLESLLKDIRDNTKKGEGDEETDDPSLGEGVMPDGIISNTSDVVNTSVVDKISNSEVVRAFNNISNIMVVDQSGTCPILSIDFPNPINQTISTDIHCEMMVSIKTIIGPIMMLLYLFLGFRIFASS